MLGENGLIRRAEQASQYQVNAEAEDNAKSDELDVHIANVLVGIEESEKIDAAYISKNASIYYGKKVNYNKANEEWEIFFADKTNIYLITKASLSDPVYNAKTLSGAANTTTYSSGSNMLTADATKGYFPAAEKHFNWPTTDNFKSTNPNMEATLFMLDSINVWNDIYHTVGTTDWAIGSPTLEMLCKSVNDVKGNTNYVATPGSAIGYPQIISSGLTNGTVWNHGNHYWLACPSSQGAGYVRYVNYTGEIVGGGRYRNAYGFRPVVCLSFGVTLEALEENGVVTEFNIVGEQ